MNGGFPISPHAAKDSSEAAAGRLVSHVKRLLLPGKAPAQNAPYGRVLSRIVCLWRPDLASTCHSIRQCMLFS
eukprot:6207835-Pleurochrysis_carterae.AAC.6